MIQKYNNTDFRKLSRVGSGIPHVIPGTGTRAIAVAENNSFHPLTRIASANALASV